MDAFEVYRSPSVKVEPPRWTGREAGREAGREDNVDRATVNDGYRRRSPGKTLVGCLRLTRIIGPSSTFADLKNLPCIKSCSIEHRLSRSFQSFSFSLLLR